MVRSRSTIGSSCLVSSGCAGDPRMRCLPCPCSWPSTASSGMKLMCAYNLSTHAGSSLDHPIRPLQERRRDRQAEGLGGLEVDDQVELDRGLSTGRSPGFAPLRILSTKVAPRRYKS